MESALVADNLQTVRKDREFQFGRVAQGALIAAGAAACLNLVVYLIAGAAGVTFTGRFNPAAPETVVALRDVLLVLNRFMERPSRVFAIVAVSFGLLSVAGPLTFPEASLGTKLALTVMHLILTAVIVGAILVRGRTPRRES
jgi:hypothetical protein